MRELQFKRQGYLYRFAAIYGPLSEYERETDICTYWRAVLGGAVVWCIAMMIGMGLGAALGDFGGWVIAGLMHGFVAPELPAALVAAVLLVASVLAAGAGCYMLQSKTNIIPEEVRESYRSWKEKTCVKVNLI